MTRQVQFYFHKLSKCKVRIFRYKIKKINHLCICKARNYHVHLHDFLIVHNESFQFRIQGEP